VLPFFLDMDFAAAATAAGKSSAGTALCIS
jgi:hypothetical protein